MLTTIKTILKDTATAQGLNFIFSSIKEVNTLIEDEDLSISTILVNSSISAMHEKTAQNSFNQVYDLHIACVRKRVIVDKDNDVFDVIGLAEADFITYLNTVGESIRLTKDLGAIKITTLYFDTATPVAGVQSEFKMTTVCQL